jgi:hypothetical protein
MIVYVRKSLGGGNGFAILVDSGDNTKALAVGVNDSALERRGDYPAEVVQELRDNELISTHAFVADMPDYSGRKLKDKKTGCHLRLTPFGIRVANELRSGGLRNDR